MREFPRRGDIWLVRLDPAVGSEIRKTRPAAVISNDINNRYAGTVTVLPISDRGEKTYPFEVAVPTAGTGLSKPSKIRCQQVRTVDATRLVKFVGSLDPDLVLLAEEALKIHLGMR